MLAHAALRRLATASAAASAAAMPRHGARSVSALTAIAQGELAGIKEAGTYKAERVITSPQSAHIRVSNRKWRATTRAPLLTAQASAESHHPRFPCKSTPPLPLCRPPAQSASRC